MSLWSVVAIGIGSMVGAGIFALLGQTALMVGRETYLAFAIGGVIAALSGYSYAGLSARYPSNGGIVDFFNLTFPSRLAGSLSLVYLLNLIISVAMIAKTFGVYAVKLFGLPHHMDSLAGSAAVIAIYLLTMIGQRAVGRVEILLVGIKLVILLSFMTGGLWFLDLDFHSSHRSSGTHSLIASVGLTFFAYAGFGMMANTAGNVANPAKTMRIAFPLAIFITAMLYIGLSIVVLGSIPPELLAADADTAIAASAKPYFGAAGFTILSIAALLATSSTINANIYSGNEMTRGLASARQLPAFLGKTLWASSTRGVLFGVMLVIVMINIFNLTTVANAAGAVFLLIYLAVFIVAWRMRHETGSSPLVLLIGFFAMGGVFVVFMQNLWQTQPVALAIFCAALIGAILLQFAIARAGQQSQT